MPFLDLNGKCPPRLQLEQLDAKSFCVLRGFIYRVPSPQKQEYTVASGQKTDLASVPFFLTWLVQTYGRHTYAVILHDYLWRKKPNNISREDANHVLRVALFELRVPFVRTWIMWTAVSLADLWMRKGWWMARVAAWAMALLAFDVMLPLAFASGGQRLYSTLTVIAGVAAIVLLLPRLPVIAIGVPALVLLIPSILVVLLMVAIYQLIEWGTYLVGLAWKRLTHIGTPVPGMNRPIIDSRKLQRDESLNRRPSGGPDDPCRPTDPCQPTVERRRVPSTEPSQPV